MNLCCTRYAKHATAFGHKNRTATIITTAKGSRQQGTQETQADEHVEGQGEGKGEEGLCWPVAQGSGWNSGSNVASLRSQNFRSEAKRNIIYLLAGLTTCTHSTRSPILPPSPLFTQIGLPRLRCTVFSHLGCNNFGHLVGHFA